MLCVTNINIENELPHLPLGVAVIVDFLRSALVSSTIIIVVQQDDKRELFHLLCRAYLNFRTYFWGELEFDSDKFDEMKKAYQVILNEVEHFVNLETLEAFKTDWEVVQ